MLANLQTFTQLTKELEDKFTQLIFYDEVEDNPYIEGLNNLIMLRSLANDIHRLFSMELGPLREKFLEEHGYIRYYAESVYSSELNYEWYCKTLAMMIEVLKELNELDLKRRAYTLVLVRLPPFSSKSSRP